MSLAVRALGGHTAGWRYSYASVFKPCTSRRFAADQAGPSFTPLHTDTTTDAGWSPAGGTEGDERWRVNYAIAISDTGDGIHRQDGARHVVIDTRNRAQSLIPLHRSSIW